jgi:predicted permease
MKIAATFRRLSLLFRRSRYRRELEEEMRFHRTEAARSYAESGMSSEQARRSAVRHFGNESLLRQRSHEVIHFRLETVMQDIRYALRTLRRDRTFFIIAALILALGIGANVAVFSVVNTLLLRPLPFPASKQLTWLEPGKNLDPALRAAGGLGAQTFMVDDFEAFQRANHSFDSVAAYNPFLGSSEYTLTGVGEARGVLGVMVSGNFFQTLGVQPELGRLFVNDELQKNGSPAVLLSHGYWARQFHSNPAIVGQAVSLNKKPYTIIGVMPAGFDFGSVFAPGMDFDVFTPAVMDEMRSWGNTLSVVGRLKPGVTIAQAQADSDLVFKQINHARTLGPNDPVYDFSPTLTQLKEHVSGKLHSPMVMMWSAVGLVLLIVCVNLSSMLIARATARKKEFALRVALGAGRARLFRQLLTESLILALAGAALGLALAYGITAYLAHQNAISLPLMNDVHVDATGLLWTLLLTLATTLVLGMVPALRMFSAKSSKNLQDSLKGTGKGTDSSSGESIRTVMVMMQVALSCMLLVGAGLLLHSFINALNVDMGFDASHASVMKIDYPQNGDGPARARALQEIVRQVSAIPGIQVVGEADMLPLGRNRSWQFWAKDNPPLKGRFDVALTRIVTPGYLAAIGIRLTAGRDFNWLDADKRQKVVIVNRAAARHFWPGKSALGRTTVLDGGDEGEARVIGVVDDVSQTSLEASAGPEIYLPAMQDPPEGADLVVRSSLPASSLSAEVLAALRNINPGQPAAELRPLTETVDRAVSPRRFFLMLVLSFAALGLLLASLGIYGIVSYSVTQRTQEIGIRMALGATRGHISRLFLGRTFSAALIGLAGGTVAALLLSQLMRSMLFGVSPMDPISFAAAIVMILVPALAATLQPTLRAAQIDPAQVLRNQ